MIERMRTDLPPAAPIHTIMTGGLGKLIASGSRYATDVDENLTLTGLRLIYERHSERQRRHR